MYRDNEDNPQYASSPCLAQELDYGPEGAVVRDLAAARDVARWRRAERERLIALRRAQPVESRQQLAQDIADEIEQWIEPGPGSRISLYWPYRAEPNLLGRLEAWHERGARVALPVVRKPREALIFREWTPSCRLIPGVLKIPVPVDGEEILPNVVIAPLVGFDAQGFRLGYGGGYFDRTLAALSPRPFVIGVGDPALQLATIYPQAHDVPMDIIVTGRASVLERPGLWPKRFN